jgi:hypothetical protein
MEACYGGTDVMERSCAVARGIDTNTIHSNGHLFLLGSGRYTPDLLLERLRNT